MGEANSGQTLCRWPAGSEARPRICQIFLIRKKTCSGAGTYGHCARSEQALGHSLSSLSGEKYCHLQSYEQRSPVHAAVSHGKRCQHAECFPSIHLQHQRKGRRDRAHASASTCCRCSGVCLLANSRLWFLACPGVCACSVHSDRVDRQIISQLSRRSHTHSGSAASLRRLTIQKIQDCAGKNFDADWQGLFVNIETRVMMLVVSLLCLVT